MRHILVLGGTLEASALAQALAQRGERALLSYAGRVAQPRPQPIAVRVGGFGGVDGLVAFLRHQGISHLVDATHPFAAQMSGNAIAAAALAQVPLLALSRPPWLPGAGDRWQLVPGIAAAVAALAGPPQRLMLALGRLHLAAFAAQPQHHYLLRLVDAPQAPPPLPLHTTLVSRGPFDLAGDLALLQAQRIDRIVCKNAGGSGAQAKLLAARALGLPVLMVQRPAIAVRPTVASVGEVLQWLDHGPSAALPTAAGPGAAAGAETERGV